MHIVDCDLGIQREPFARPFGFKGSYFHEKWNAVVRLTDKTGASAVGVGGLAVLWSDAAVFAAHTETGGNLLMLSVLEHALQRVRGTDFADPPALLEAVLPEIHEYGKTVTDNRGLRGTFTLNALVALDNAAWLLHARNTGAADFDALIPEPARAALANRQTRVAAVPLLSYKLSGNDIKEILEQGAFFLKIKIGQPGTEQDMLEKDIARLTEIHELARRYETDMTEPGKPLYYLDANGRYRDKDTLARLLEHAEKNGMLEQVALVEEPFAEELDIDVAQFAVPVAADESLHSVRDLHAKLGLGYGAIAIKPAGKTLSVAFAMAQAAHAAGVPCYVADNACVPLLVDWNKNFAARLPAFPGLKCGILESNGPSSYGNWAEQLERHPCPTASWLKPAAGAFTLEDEFYARSGGIFEEPAFFARFVQDGDDALNP